MKREVLKRSETHGLPRDGFQRLPLILCNHLHHQNPSERSILLQYVDHPFALCCPSIVADLSDPSNCWHRSIIVSDVVHALESREPQILVQYYSVSKLLYPFLTFVAEIPFERSYDLSMSQPCRICIQDHIDIFPKRKKGKGKYVWIQLIACTRSAGTE